MSRQRLLDVLSLALAVAVVLGAFYLFQRIRYHDAMDRALLDILQKQVPAERHQKE